MSNGLGPAWFPDWLRQMFTKFGSTFFEEASWDHHDEGYKAGLPARNVCDRKFLCAMLRDASNTEATIKVAACTILAWFFWLMVRLFGWMSYRTQALNPPP